MCRCARVDCVRVYVCKCPEIGVGMYVNSSGCSCLVSTQGVRSPYGPAGQWDERIFFYQYRALGGGRARGME